MKAILLAIAITSLLPLPANAAGFSICKGGHRVTCVVDGDTFWIEGEKVRVDGYDSPEMGEPKCARPAAGAVEARDALAELLNSGTVELARTGVDRYGRTLARVLVDGQDITKAMIGAGHGRRYQRGQQPWC
jgi:endonuclease YncB( thermonuclease family)